MVPLGGRSGSGAFRRRHGGRTITSRARRANVSTSLKPYERMIAKALQEYGAFDVKNAKTFGFRSEYGARPPGGSSGYTPLTDIRFAKYLRVGTIVPEP